MSEEAKLAYIQKKLKEFEGKKRDGTSAFVIGVGFLILYVFFATLFWSPTAPQALIFLLIGLPLGAGGYIQSHYYERKHAALMRQLKKMAYQNVCPKCRKQIPKGNYTFCSFCAELLERKL